MLFMSEENPSILQRMARASRQDRDHGVVSIYGAMRLALSKAAQDVARGPLRGDNVEDMRITLRTIAGQVPDSGLWMLLQGPDQARGLICFDSSFLSGLVQLLTTGRVSGAQVANRQATETDALLVRKFAALFLETLAKRLLGHPFQAWAAEFHPRERVVDAARLPHLMPDVLYHGLSMEVDIGDGLRTGKILLILPQVAFDAEHQVKKGAANGDFSEAWKKVVLKAPFELQAVLCRLSVPLSQLKKLKQGEKFYVPLSLLQNITLEGMNGQKFGSGQLGIAEGYFAVRLHDPKARNSTNVVPPSTHSDFLEGYIPDVPLPFEGAGVEESIEDLLGRQENEGATALKDPAIGKKTT
jgi:flagellar motor switch protein FliM